MSVRISFQGMPHSNAIENYVRSKIEKIHKFIHDEQSPHNFEMHLKAHPNHAHQEVSMFIKAKALSLNAKEEGVDIYLVIDGVIDKVVSLLKKEYAKIRDSHRVSEKDKFFK